MRKQLHTTKPLLPLQHALLLPPLFLQSAQATAENNPQPPPPGQREEQKPSADVYSSAAVP